MHHKNCLMCKKSRSDYGFFGEQRFHCDDQKVHPTYAHWYMRQNFTRDQWDLIQAIGCASWESNTSA